MNDNDITCLQNRPKQDRIKFVNRAFKFVNPALITAYRADL